MRERELPTAAFARAIGVNSHTIYDFRDGRAIMGKNITARFARIIPLWEAGYLEFARANKHEPIRMIRRQTPKPRPNVCKVSLDGRPSLSIKPRPVLDAHTPIFRDIFAKKG